MWEVAPGGQLPEFKKRAVTDSDFVLVIYTPGYRECSDGHCGRVGYKRHIITLEILARGNHEKLIPTLCRGTRDNREPTYYFGISNPISDISSTRTHKVYVEELIDDCSTTACARAEQPGHGRAYRHGHGAGGREADGGHLRRRRRAGQCDLRLTLGCHRRWNGT